MEKLTKEEWQFCKKLQDKIVTMKYITRSQRQEIIKYIQGKCSNKYTCEIKILNESSEIEIYEFKLSNKSNFLCFDLHNNKKPIITPYASF